LSRFVLDTSVTVAWCFEEETTPYTEGVLNALVKGEALVPCLWPLEVSNVLVNAERRKRITRAKVTRFLQLLGDFPITVDTEGGARVFTEVLSVAREHDLSAYDAAYLELALRQGLPLATLDTRLRHAARRAGVELFA
jgi:predicted nucleic acid-binding protein